MATMPPGMGPNLGAGGGLNVPGPPALDAMPPSPAIAAPALAAQGFGAGPQEAERKVQLKGLLDALGRVDLVLMLAAREMPEGAKDFGTARELIEAGIVKAVGAEDLASSSPGDTGTQFPGGEFGGVLPGNSSGTAL